MDAYKIGILTEHGKSVAYRILTFLSAFDQPVFQSARIASGNIRDSLFVFLAADYYEFGEQPRIPVSCYASRKSTVPSELHQDLILFCMHTAAAAGSNYDTADIH